MNPNPKSAIPPHRRDRRGYTLGLAGVAVGLVAAVGLAAYEKVRESSARMQ